MDRDSKSQKISRIGRDLKERETIIDDDIGSIIDVAVDWVAGNKIFYWNILGDFVVAC